MSSLRYCYTFLRRKTFNSLILKACSDDGSGTLNSQLITKKERSKSAGTKKWEQGPLVISILILLGTAVVETLLFDLDASKNTLPNLGNSSFLEKYVHLTFITVHDNNTILFTLVASLYYLLSKMSTFAGIVGDMMCIVISFGLARKTQSISTDLRELFTKHEWKISAVQKSIGAASNEPFQISKAQSWGKIHQTLVELRKLSSEVSWLLSPIFTISIVEATLNVIINVSSIYISNKLGGVLSMYLILVKNDFFIAEPNRKCVGFVLPQSAILYLPVSDSSCPSITN